MGSTSEQWVFLFGEKDPDIVFLGGKGAGLSQMVRLGLPVPPGFTVSTTLARYYQERGRLPDNFMAQLREGIQEVEFRTGAKFGETKNPLLVSVRSGAAVSMPGMMDTVLNLGLNPETVEGLARISGSPIFAWDSYRRFLEMYGEIVHGIDKSEFLARLEFFKEKYGLVNGLFRLEVLQKLCKTYRSMLEWSVGTLKNLDNPWHQLESTIIAVLRSWDNERAKEYRRLNGISDSLGTAVNIQAMVFGNLGNTSGTGVVFSRNVSTGARGLYGEFLPKAQGEDVVAGTRTPEPISKMREWNPRVYADLEKIVLMLERHYEDVVDVEFTVENGVLYILQVRSAKRTPEAAVVIAVDMVQEGIWTQDHAVKKVPLSQVRGLRYKSQFDPRALEEAVANRLLAKGIPASPGVAVGLVAFSSEKAEQWKQEGRNVILVRPDTSPDDLSGMIASVGIVTKTGGLTSHAAVVARSLNKPAVVGASDLNIQEGEIISVDGTAGVVLRGEVALKVTSHTEMVSFFLKWVGDSGTIARPRIGFEYIDQSLNLHQLINDFYLVDMMALSVRGTPLENEADLLRAEIHQMTAERLAAYLLVAIAGELRHYNDGNALDGKPQKNYNEGCTCADCTINKERYEKALREWEDQQRTKKPPETPFSILRRKYGVVLGRTDGRSRAQAQLEVIKKLRGMSFEDQTEFFRLAMEAFNEARWSRQVGGKTWAAIARAGWQFLTGELNHSAFADHAFDLEHNNGTVFGKHDMLPVNRAYVREQLNIKKQARGVADLKSRFSARYDKYSPEVLSLYRRGEQSNWTFAQTLAA